jgi:transposase
MSAKQAIQTGRSAAPPPERVQQRAKTGRPHPEDLRSRVVAAIEAGASYREAAARFGVSGSAAVKWVQRFRQTGSTAAKPMGGDRRSRLKSERDWLLRRIAAEPGVTPAELHKELCARGIQVGYLTVSRFVKKQRTQLKKKTARQQIRPPARTKSAPAVTGTTRKRRTAAAARPGQIENDGGIS